MDPSNQSDIIITHIHIEGNSRVDYFTNIDLNTSSIIFFYSILIEIRRNFVKNKLSIHFFRFSTS